MPSLESVAKLWTGEEEFGQASDEFQEGFDVFEVLNKLINPTKGIIDIGCGTGRLCRAFPAERYVGLDVNPHAIQKARLENPEFEFREMQPGGQLPTAGTALIYMVGCCIPDEELARFLMTVCTACPLVVICEMMDSRWRHKGLPPSFNRDPEHYILEMANRGYLLWRFGKATCADFDMPPYNIDKDQRMSFHLYARAAS